MKQSRKVSASFKSRLHKHTQISEAEPNKPSSHVSKQSSLISQRAESPISYDLSVNPCLSINDPWKSSPWRLPASVKTPQVSSIDSSTSLSCIKTASVSDRKFVDFEVFNRNLMISDNEKQSSLSTPKGKITRKDSRSATEVNSPSAGYMQPFGQLADEIQSKSSIRNSKRTSTQLASSSKKKVTITSQDLEKLKSLCKNYKNEQTPSRIIQKVRPNADLLHNSNDIIVHDIKYSSPKASLTKTNSLNEIKDLSILKTSRRLSVASNGSMFSDAHIEVLTELGKSVKELNQRLIKSEEVTYERLQENLKLKEQIKFLEMKIHYLLFR